MLLFPEHPEEEGGWLYLGDLDSRGRSREARQAGPELPHGAEVPLADGVDARHPEPVAVSRGQLLLLPALVVLGPRKLPLEGGEEEYGTVGAATHNY